MKPPFPARSYPLHTCYSQGGILSSFPIFIGVISTRIPKIGLIIAGKKVGFKKFFREIFLDGRKGYFYNFPSTHEETADAKVQPSTQAGPRFSPPDALKGRPKGLCPEAAEGPETPCSVRKRPPPLFTSKGKWSNLFIYNKLGSEEGNFGISIPRALYPNSTSRNRVRRQIREAVRLFQKEEGKPAGGAKGFLIRVKRKEKWTFQAIRQEIENHFRQLENRS